MHMCTEERPHENTAKGSHLKAKERGLQRNQTCWHTDLGTSSLQNFEKTSLCCLGHPVCAVFCYGAPSKLMQWYKKYDSCLWPYRGILPIVAQTVCSMKTQNCTLSLAYNGCSIIIIERRYERTGKVFICRISAYCMHNVAYNNLPFLWIPPGSNS